MTKYFWAKSLCLVLAFLFMGTLSVSDVATQAQQAADNEEPDVDYMMAQKNYLDEHADNKGFITRPGGLLVKRIRAGKGKFPSKTNMVTVNYSGALVDGSVFDSSYARNEPVTFEVTGVIRGWTQALLLMREGSKCEVIVPSTLGYGAIGSPPVIPPYAALHFTVELLTVQGPR